MIPGIIFVRYKNRTNFNFFIYQLRPSRGNMKIVHTASNVHKTFNKHVREGKSWMIERARTDRNI